MKNMLDIVNELRQLNEKDRNIILNKMSNKEKKIAVRLLEIIKEKQRCQDNGF